ncbi:MAG: class I SAM-dependent methyltransferase [Magnetococcales bacterium]|nr:class I SAM-dependent methyltransferase [Magnetococcales bacterium]
MKCRHCDAVLGLPVVDLGSSPPSNAYITEQALHEVELWFPLRVMVCENCWLVQIVYLPDVDRFFNAEYAYFSSISKSWLAHSERYVTDMVDRFGLNTHSQVVEVAANDGYLLQYFQKRHVPCLGIEPTASTAAAARDRGVAIIEEFFNDSLARTLLSQGRQADLIVANNVLAHVPDINRFVSGFSILLKPSGVATFEFPHLLNLIRYNQFDTIYHEHSFYLSLLAVQRIFSQNGLAVFDVEEHSTHGGSLRVFAQRSDAQHHLTQERVKKLLELEVQAGLNTPDYYLGFQAKADRVKRDLIRFLLDVQARGERVAAYGAAAKGNTLLNYSGVRSDLIPFVVDRSPLKQGKYLPGSRIPIVAEARIKVEKPDYILILPWNIKEEIMTQLSYIGAWGGRFVTAIPTLEITD